MAQAACRIKEYTPTFSLDSTEHLRSYWASLTHPRSICGRLGA